MPEEAIQNVTDTLRTRWIGQGPKVDAVEKKFEETLGVSNAVTMNSGTSSLHLALILAGIREGDEVIATPMTCTATNIPILHAGGVPVFADIQEDTLNIDPKSIREKITPKTKAILCVHFGGYPCDMELLKKIAKKNS